MNRVYSKYLALTISFVLLCYSALAEDIQFYGFGITDTLFVDGKPVALIEDGDTTFILNTDTNQIQLPFGEIPETSAGDLYHPMFLTNPDNTQDTTIYDPETGLYTTQETIGGFELRSPKVLTFEEFQKEQEEREKSDYWRERQKSERYNNLGNNSILNLGEKEGLFGKDFVSIKPQGTAELIFSLRGNNTENPAIPVRDRKRTTFSFDEKIQMNVTGTIGDKLKLTTSFDTETTFEFDNQMKLQYEGGEDEIIKKLEAGNVSLPLNSSLIKGSQSLFGVKAEMQFGRLRVTSVFSQQKGESKTIEISGGALKKEFEIRADDYEANKHFFLSHYFKDQYDNALANLPFVSSQIQITQLEVWTTNINFGNVQNSRNILAIADLGTSDISQLTDPNIQNPTGALVPDNAANNLYEDLDQAGARDFNAITQAMADRIYEEGVHYNKIENARKLSPSEYTFNPLLGYISLNRSVNNDEVIGVSFQYTYNGQVYQVGDISTMAGNLENDDVLFLKLIKSTQVNNTQIPLWELMMKNVYALGEYNVKEESFLLDILYQDPERGNFINYIPEEGVDPKLFIQITGADQINKQGDDLVDGIFDFIDGVTITPQNGRIYFPVREPFGSSMRNTIDNDEIADKYVFDSLYTNAQIQAQINYPDKNRFFIKGSYESSSSSDISLNAMNVPEGSVIVTAGGVQLEENIDYTVDYQLGRVKILNQGILNAGTPISISLESNSLFAVNQRTMMGAQFDYEVNRDLSLNGTIMRLTEMPITQKVNIGNEPIANTVIGVGGNYRAEAPYITKLVDMIPFIDTKEMSTIAVTGEYAKLFPGSPRAIKDSLGDGLAYVDDFEGSQTSIAYQIPQAWFLASTPQDPDKFPEGMLINSVASGFNRARLSWFRMDQLFTTNNSNTPTHISDNPDYQNNNYVRRILQTEISPNKDIPAGQPGLLDMMNLAYYPNERGPYNYDVDGTAPDSLTQQVYSAGVNEDGSLAEPETRWGGIMRRLQTIDFQSANIEFIEIWMMDPFDQDYQELFGEEPDANGGGDIYIHLGNISEDILRDSRKSFENGNPADGSEDLLEETAWGKVPSVPALVNAFDNNPESRPNQDIGIDGLSSAEEREFFKLPFLDRLEAYHGVNSDAYQEAFEDPSSDDYKFYLGDDFDATQLMIHERYKLYNGLEGNSATNEQTGGVSTMATTIPDVEDINRDQTLSESESYYEYKISIRQQDLVVGKNHVTQVLEANNNAGNKTVKWYQFKIPITSPQNVVGNIQDFRSIRFMRMLMKNFSQPVICRLGRFELVRSQWRRYEFSLLDDGEYVPNDELGNTRFDVSAVNIEDNAAKTPVPYVVPPGIIRERNVSDPRLGNLNEQSLLMNVCGLQDGDARAVYKNVDIDMRSYGKLKMFAHAEKMLSDLDDLQSGDVTAFIRLGSDFDQNYYEYELPLELTDTLASLDDPEVVWPEANNFDIDFNELTRAKLLRPKDNTQAVYSYFPKDDGKKVSVKGNPNLASVRVIMIGVRNPKNDNDEKCIEVWFNELRMTDFYDHGGWAATASVTSRLADFGQVSLSGFMSTPGWGSIEKKLPERSRETIQQFDGTASLQLDKFLPEKSGIKIPVYASYSKSITKPEFNPLDPDVAFTDDTIYNQAKELAQTINERRSINLSNVRKVRTNKKKKPMPYDVENFDFTYSFSETNFRDVNTEFNNTKNYRAAVNYVYNAKPKNIKPFRKTPLLKSIRQKVLDNYKESETALRKEVSVLRRENPRSDELKEKEAELEELRAKKASFQNWSSKALRSPWLRPIKQFNFYYMPSKLSVRADINRMYNEVKSRNNTDFEILLDTNFNKNFSFDRVYDFKFDLAKNLKLSLQANNQARVDEPEGRIDEDWERDSIRFNVYDLGRTTQYNQTFDADYKIPINLFPITDWVSSDVGYRSQYTWMAAPLSVSDLGNQISNSRTVDFSVKGNMNRFYNKIDYLKQLNKSSRKKGPARLPVKGEVKKAEKDTTKKDPSDITFKDVVDQMLITTMMLKNINVSYRETQGTVVPSYIPQTTIFGNDLNYNSGGSDFFNTLAPGLDFVFGGQPDLKTLKSRFVEKNWLVADTSINQRLSRTFSQDITFRATVQPFNKFRIQVEGFQKRTNNESELFRWDGSFDDNGDEIFDSFTQTQTASFTSTIITWGTAFERLDASNNYESEAYNRFAINRQNMSRELALRDNLLGLSPEQQDTAYGQDHQDVLISAFLAAYTNTDVATWRSMFISIPRPNWGFTYSGLTSLDIVGKYAKSVQISHKYKSNYSTGNYTNNLNYVSPEEFGFFDGVNSVIPEFIVNNVVIEEKFAPLAKLDIKWNNKIITKIEMNRSRTLTLSLSARRMMEMRGSDLIIGTGYVFKGVEIPVTLPGGTKKRLKSDLDLRFDLSIRSNLTLTRELDGNVVQATGGDRVVSLKTSADYQVSDRLILRVFYDRMLTDPVISNSFRNITSNGGVSVRFNLAQ